MKTTGYVLRSFHQGNRKPTGQNIAGSFFTSRNSTPVTFDRERDAGLFGKREDILDRCRQIHIEICRIIRICYLADSMNNVLE